MMMLAVVIGMIVSLPEMMTDNGIYDDNRSQNLLGSSPEEDDAVGDLPVVPVAATYKVDHGLEKVYELSQTMSMLRTYSNYCNK